jgi:hypothetical protein
MKPSALFKRTNTTITQSLRKGQAALNPFDSLIRSGNHPAKSLIKMADRAHSASFKNPLKITIYDDSIVHMYGVSGGDIFDASIGYKFFNSPSEIESCIPEFLVVCFFNFFSKYF